MSELPKSIQKVIQELTKQLKRSPTVDEVVDYVFGNQDMKNLILSGKYVSANKGEK